MTSVFIHYNSAVYRVEAPLICSPSRVPGRCRAVQCGLASVVLRHRSCALEHHSEEELLWQCELCVERNKQNRFNSWVKIFYVAG